MAVVQPFDLLSCLFFHFSHSSYFVDAMNVHPIEIMFKLALFNMYDKQTCLGGLNNK